MAGLLVTRFEISWKRMLLFFPHLSPFSSSDHGQSERLEGKQAGAWFLRHPGIVPMVCEKQEIVPTVYLINFKRICTRCRSNSPLIPHFFCEGPLAGGVSKWSSLPPIYYDICSSACELRCARYGLTKSPDVSKDYESLVSISTSSYQPSHDRIRTNVYC